MRKKTISFFSALILGLSGGTLEAQDLLQNLGKAQHFQSKRISSFDKTGGNNDRISLAQGETAVLAEITGPGAIHHIWVTIMAEAFYGRTIILRMYWDGEEQPSVEAPIGDFFGVGHGLDRNLSSLAIANSSEGRARNCYWYMPFQTSTRITATNEGGREVGAFYYYIDYRVLSEWEEDIPYFHAQYGQEMPCIPEKNYVILDARGRGHYVGCNLSILQRALGWWGEGDDMIFVDGEKFPGLHGTGSEDYFSDAWGMREDENLFYGCPLQEPDFKSGSKATVYRHHIPDPIPFQKSIQVSIEHGHANDRSDYFSSVAYWYQTEPHAAFPALPPVKERLPFARDLPGLHIPHWEPAKTDSREIYFDPVTKMTAAGKNLLPEFSSFYNEKGERYAVLSTDGGRTGDELKLGVEAPVGEFYDMKLYYAVGPNRGTVTPVRLEQDLSRYTLDETLIDGYAAETDIEHTTLQDVRLQEGSNLLVFRLEGKQTKADAQEFGLVGLSISPSQPHFMSEWNLIGPFTAPDMSYLLIPYPPENSSDLSQSFPGKGGKQVKWQRASSLSSGFVPLQSLFQSNEQAIVYGLAYVYSPEKRSTSLLIGSDDGVRLWLNEEMVHSNPAYRGAYPDQDRIPVQLRKGWNSVLVKVLQGAGGWGFYVRFVDPDKTLFYSTEIN